MPHRPYWRTAAEKTKAKNNRKPSSNEDEQGQQDDHEQEEGEPLYVFLTGLQEVAPLSDGSGEDQGEKAARSTMGSDVATIFGSQACLFGSYEKDGEIVTDFTKMHPFLSSLVFSVFEPSETVGEFKNKASHEDEALEHDMKTREHEKSKKNQKGKAVDVVLPSSEQSVSDELQEAGGPSLQLQAGWTKRELCTLDYAVEDWIAQTRKKSHEDIELEGGTTTIATRSDSSSASSRVPSYYVSKEIRRRIRRRVQQDIAAHGPPRSVFPDTLPYDPTRNFYARTLKIAEEEHPVSLFE
ncbi:unnamed protein product, partial [Amoebophrya sp. A25]|eukprot:GSA25T00013794001.1